MAAVGGTGGIRAWEALCQPTHIPPCTAHMYTLAHTHPSASGSYRVWAGYHREHAIGRVPTRPVPLRAVSVGGRIGGKWAKGEMILQGVCLGGGPFGS